jgi:hypothetical protein
MVAGGSVAAGVAAGAQAVRTRAITSIAPSKVGYLILLTPFKSIRIDPLTIRVRDACLNGEYYAHIMEEYPPRHS